MIRILIVDDHAIMRDGLKQILADSEDMRVVDEADNGLDALKKVQQHKLDAVVLDMSMPGLSGIELIKRLKSEKPGLPVLVLSMHSEKQYAGHTIRAGASGYLCKASAAPNLVQALRKIAGGGTYLSPETAKAMAADKLAKNTALPHTLLSMRELEIFKLLASGNSVTEIASQFGISVKTISTHKTNIMQKMNLSNMSDLICYALTYGLLEPPDKF